jgi:hypothetical protein
MKKLVLMLVLVTTIVAMPIFGDDDSQWPPAPKGPPTFVEEPAPEGKCIIYIYSVFQTNFYAPLILAKDGPITVLPVNTYFAYVTDPGAVKIWVAASESKELTVEVLAGQAYYIRVNLMLHFGRPLPGTSIELIPAAKAKVDDEILY